jgi:hypothetical protein
MPSWSSEDGDEDVSDDGSKSSKSSNSEALSWDWDGFINDWWWWGAMKDGDRGFICFAGWVPAGMKAFTLSIEEEVRIRIPTASE